MAKSLREEKVEEVINVVRSILSGDAEKREKLMDYFKLSYPVEGMSKLEIAVTISRDQEIITFLKRVIDKMDFEISVLEAEAKRRRTK